MPRPPALPRLTLNPAAAMPPRPCSPQRLEPKTFLASERTFLSWMHMSVTIGSIAAALLAFSADAVKSTSPMHAVSGARGARWRRRRRTRC